MSSNRKLRRAQQARAARAGASAPAPVASGKNRDELRRQTADERFAKPGADVLWQALLGWTDERRARMWLAQAVHDGARRRERGADDPAAVAHDFARRCPPALAAAAQKLEADEAKAAVAAWLSSGDAYSSDEPAPKWKYLADLSGELGLGEAAARGLQDDWEVWTSLALAGRPRALLMELLSQTEKAATALNELTLSENVGAVGSMTRVLWYALAYGDEETFRLLREWSARWLVERAKKKP